MKKISKIFGEPWSISRADYAVLMAAIMPAIKAGNLQQVNETLDRNKVQAYGVQLPYCADKWELDDMNLPVDSVAVITLEGMLFSWETFRLEERLQQCFDNPRICGVVLWINGPGGMTTHLNVAAKMIHEAPKPVCTYVAEQMCSAHLWLGTAASHIILAHEMVTVGSVGVMLRYMDESGYLKQLGMDVRDIYPDTADLKNYESRQIATANNEQPMKEHLQKLHMAFCRDVSQNTGIKYDPEAEVFRGKLFAGDEAIAIGLAHEYGALSDAVKWTFAQAQLHRD